MRPCAGCARRRTSPRFSSASRTSFIDCDDTSERRASCAFDSPLRRASTLSVVYCAADSPCGRTTSLIDAPHDAVDPPDQIEQAELRAGGSTGRGLGWAAGAADPSGPEEVGGVEQVRASAFSSSAVPS